MGVACRRVSEVRKRPRRRGSSKLDSDVREGRRRYLAGGRRARTLGTGGGRSRRRLKFVSGVRKAPSQSSPSPPRGGDTGRGSFFGTSCDGEFTENHVLVGFRPDPCRGTRGRNPPAHSLRRRPPTATVRGAPQGPTMLCTRAADTQRPRPMKLCFPVSLGPFIFPPERRRPSRLDQGTRTPTVAEVGLGTVSRRGVFPFILLRSSSSVFPSCEAFRAPHGDRRVGK